jgi:hypothetical protein
MRALVLCTSCKRHVKASDTHCPFCSSAVVRERSQGAGSARGLPGGRAALFLTGAALAAPGCADEHEPDDGRDSISVPVYGVAIDPARDAGIANRQDAGAVVDAGRDAGRDAGLIAQPYGIPVPLDASIRTPLDAGPRCPQVGNLPVPVYGIGIDIPPRDSCSDAGADAGKDAGADAGKDAGADAGKDSGLTTVPPYGIAIDRDL